MATSNSTTHSQLLLIYFAAECDTNVEGIGILQGLPKQIESLSWQRKG
jgi:hypothetical protein